MPLGADLAHAHLAVKLELRYTYIHTSAFIQPMHFQCYAQGYIPLPSPYY